MQDEMEVSDQDIIESIPILTEEDFIFGNDELWFQEDSDVIKPARIVPPPLPI